MSGAAEVGSALDRLKRSQGWTDAPEWAGTDDPRASKPRLGRLKLVPVAAAVLSLALFALVALRPGSDPSDQRLDQAMASVAAVVPGEPTAPLATGEFRFLRTITAYRDTAVSGGVAWMTTRPRLTERWVDASGSGRERVVEGGQQFASADDRQTWMRAGSPNIGEIDGSPQVKERRLTASDARYALEIPIEEVPADAPGLSRLIVSTAEQANGSAPTAAKAVELIGDLLRDPATSGAVRKAAYLSLAEIDGITHLGARPDPLGRPGEAVGVGSGYSGIETEYALVYSPSTGRPLAFTQRRLASPGSGSYFGVEIYVDQGRTTSTGRLPEGVARLDGQTVDRMLAGVIDAAGLAEAGSD